jgi:hypothetical protein
VELEMVRALSVDEISRQFSKVAGLEVHSRENRYWELTAPTERIDELLPNRFPLEGLLPAELGESWIRQALSELMPGVPAESWLVESGELVYQPSLMDVRTWFAATRLLDTWRVAAGLGTELVSYAPQNVLTKLVEQVDVPGLERVTNQVFPQALPLSQLLTRIGAEAGVRIWVDWQHVAELGLSPATTSSIVVTSRSLRDVLKDCVELFGVVVAIEDQRTLRLTSPQAFRADARLFLAPSEGLTAEQWQQKLRPLTPADAGGVGRVVALATPDSRFALLRCCRSLVEF